MVGNIGLYYSHNSDQAQVAQCKGTLFAGEGVCREHPPAPAPGLLLQPRWFLEASHELSPPAHADACHPSWSQTAPVTASAWWTPRNPALMTPGIFQHWLVPIAPDDSCHPRLPSRLSQTQAFSQAQHKADNHRIRLSKHPFTRLAPTVPGPGHTPTPGWTVWSQPTASFLWTQASRPP